MWKTLVQALSLPAGICTPISYHTALGFGGCFGVYRLCLFLLTQCHLAYTFALHLNIRYCTDGTSYLVLPKAPGDITIFLRAISLLQQAMEFAK